MYVTLLQEIAKKAESQGRGLQPPCSEQELKALRCRVRDELAVELPDPYSAFLRTTNGLDWNGLVVYASERTPIVGFDNRFIEGVVEANLDHRDYPVFKDLLVFADDGVVVFVFDSKAKEFQVRSSVGVDVVASFSTFDELMQNAFEGHP